MTNFAKPVAQRPQNWLAQLRALSAANAAGGTSYTVEYPKRKTGDTTPESERGVSVAITGNVETDHEGNATGLAGWGQAVKNTSTGNWEKVSGATAFATGAEAVNANVTASVVARLEESGATARLEGSLQASGAAIPANTALFTIPSAYRPERTNRFSAFNASTGSTGFIIVVAGVVTFDLELPKGDYLQWGSLSYAV